MARKIRKLINDVCMDRCHLIAEYCRQEEDGAWDCSITSQDCKARCRGR